MEFDLGGRLRYVRGLHNLSQRELARRAGITNSTISLIESNQTNTSVGALKRILDGIPIGLAEFFARNREGEDLLPSGRKHPVRPGAPDPQGTV